MSPPILTKFVFKIRTRNGVIVENLQLLGVDQEYAERNLRQMYIKCQVLEVLTISPDVASTYEDVLNIIVKR